MRDQSESAEFVAEQSQWRLNSWFSDLSSNDLNLFENYYQDLIRFNKATNLISTKTLYNADLIHFADCIIGSRIIFQNTGSDIFYDIGSGNGFPGVVMAVLEPKRKFILVDSDFRRIEFLKHVISALSLKNAEVLNTRVEDIQAETIEYGVSRAFAPLAKSMRMCQEAFKPGGIHYHFKSDSWGTEVLRLPIQVGRKWEPSLIGDYNLPGVSIKLSIVGIRRALRR